MRRPLLLGGFMATGKSTVARRVAELAGVRCHDLDRAIEESSGRSIAELFQTEGEPGFRQRERAELERLLEQDGPCVVALGGGALLDREIRLRALERAVVVTLVARLDVVLSRAGASGFRPLLGGGASAEARARTLLETRANAYAEAHAQIDTSELDADAAARAAWEVWKRDPVAVAVGPASYAVDVARGGRDRLLSTSVGKPSSVLLVTDENVERLHGEPTRKALRRPAATLILEPGEQKKTISALERVWREALGSGLDRAGVIVALGGGVVSDIAGFAAATWMRGVRWIVVPTSLLAMVDASIGGKTAVDFADAKNSLGAFWQPSGVICDVELLQTEPERGYRSALAEVIKTALVGDRELLEILERAPDAVTSRDGDLLDDIVRRSVSVKARIVSRDAHESGLRMVLNLGHTLGHALEAATGFSSYTHGEAVSLGLVGALRAGVRLGLTPELVADRVEALLGALKLPVDLTQAPLAAALQLLERDKKRRGTYMHFIAVRDVGEVEALRIEPGEVRTLLANG